MLESTNALMSIHIPRAPKFECFVRVHIDRVKMLADRSYAKCDCVIETITPGIKKRNETQFPTAIANKARVVAGERIGEERGFGRLKKIIIC